MLRRFLFGLLPVALGATFPTIARGQALWTCPNDDPSTPEFEQTTVDCDAHIVTLKGSTSTIDVPAVNCEESPPPATDADGAFRYDCCCSGLLSAGDLPTTLTGRVGGSTGMERDFFASFCPILVNRNSGLIEAVDFTHLLGIATRTKETHRLLFQASVLPKGFGDSDIGGAAAIALQVRNDRGVNKLGVAAIVAPVDTNGVRVSALNGFAHKYLGKAGNPLGLLELGTCEAPGDAVGASAERDPTKSYFHVVEHVRSLNGDGSIRSDSFGVMAEVMVRVYTVPRP